MRADDLNKPNQKDLLDNLSRNADEVRKSLYHPDYSATDIHPFKDVMLKWLDLALDSREEIDADIRDGYNYIDMVRLNSGGQLPCLSNGNNSKIYSNMYPPMNAFLKSAYEAASVLSLSRLSDVMKQARTAYQQSIDARLLERMHVHSSAELEKAVSDSYEISNVGRLSVLGCVDDINAVIHRAEMGAVIHKAVYEDFLEDTSIDCDERAFLRDSVTHNYTEVAQRLAAKFRDDILIGTKKWDLREDIQNNTVLFIRDADYRVRLEFLEMDFMRGGIPYQATTINAQGDKKLREFTPDFMNRVLGYGKFYPNDSGSINGSDYTVDIHCLVTDGTSDCHLDDQGIGSYVVQCKNNSVGSGATVPHGEFISPVVADAYAILLKDQLRGSIINPEGGTLAHDLMVWERVINGDGPMLVNYQRENVGKVKESLNAFQSNVLALSDNQLDSATKVALRNGIKTLQSVLRAADDDLLDGSASDSVNIQHVATTKTGFRP